MPHLFIFGLGYSAKRVRAATEDLGWRVTATGGDGELAFEDAERVRAALGAASHVLSSVPPGASGDPVLARYGDSLAPGGTRNTAGSPGASRISTNVSVTTSQRRRSAPVSRRRR